MSDHTMTIEWDAGRADYRLTCAAEADAPCRLEFDCECEAYVGTGIDPERGPWHGLVEDHMTNAQLANLRSTGERPRHYGKFGGECTVALWINESGMTDELGAGSITFPIDAEWDGDDWLWSPS